ncbi:MAG: hypothetical protein MI919_05320 [Holophagales bacterium]|nr:hypothetical protein [Holophagales bacterium]
MLLVLVAPSANAGIDPFYEQLYQDGRLALDRQDFVGATEQLRLACFGMLEDVEPLTECLVLLSLAQAGLENEEAFLATLSRILEVERRFGGYSRFRLSPVLERAFEARVEQWAPYDLIARVEAFRSVADRKLVQRLEDLPEEDRRQELDRRIAVDPSNPQWRRALAELELEQGNFAAAAEGAATLVDLLPEDREARCLRGRARVAAESCDPITLEDLGNCDGAAAGPAELALLECHVSQGSWAEARRILDGMSADQKRRGPIRRLERQVRRAAPEIEAAAPEAEIEESPAAESVAASGPSDSERLALETGWRTLHSDERSAFDQAFRSARELADRHPIWSEAQHLVAELAYRLSRWDEAVTYFRRAEEIVDQKPNLQFYMAVALFKSGDRPAAQEMLDRCEPHIQDSGYVQFWTRRIRGEEP